MPIKVRFMQFVGKIVLTVLRTVDRYTNGSDSGRTAKQMRQDPYTGLGLARRRGPILRNRGWVVLGFDAAQAVFKDPRFGSDMRRNKWLTKLLRAGANGRPVPPLDNPSMLTLDAPDHTRLRKLASKAFLHKYIQSLEPQIEAIMQRCMADIDTDIGQFDVIEKIANPLPAIVIAEMLGLPEADRTQFQAWSNALLGATNLDKPELIEPSSIAGEELEAYLAGIIEQKRGQPGNDFICQLIAAEEEGDRLSADEMYATCALLLNAGHETTTRLISNGLYLLLQHPEQLAMLQNDRSLMPNAIEEMLRYEPPVQFMPRYATEDIAFCGKQIKRDQLILVMISSANRDDAGNPNGEIFDITRDAVKHVSFGHGIHLCLGLALARMEATIAFNALFDHFPNLGLAPQQVTWSNNLFVRGLDQLIVECGDPAPRKSGPTFVSISEI